MCFYMGQHTFAVAHRDPEEFIADKSYSDASYLYVGKSEETSYVLNASINRWAETNQAETRDKARSKTG